jgi:hypothetical protein
MHSVAYLEIWKAGGGGRPKIFDDLFWDADQPPEIPV